MLLLLFFNIPRNAIQYSAICRKIIAINCFDSMTMKNLF